jgi:hypothetical protein
VQRARGPIHVRERSVHGAFETELIKPVDQGSPNEALVLAKLEL